MSHLANSPITFSLSIVEVMSGRASCAEFVLVNGTPCPLPIRS